MQRGSQWSGNGTVWTGKVHAHACWCEAALRDRKCMPGLPPARPWCFGSLVSDARRDSPERRFAPWALASPWARLQGRAEQEEALVVHVPAHGQPPSLAALSNHGRCIESSEVSQQRESTLSSLLQIVTNPWTDWLRSMQTPRTLNRSLKGRGLLAITSKTPTQSIQESFGCLSSWFGVIIENSGPNSKFFCFSSSTLRVHTKGACLASSSTIWNKNTVFFWSKHMRDLKVGSVSLICWTIIWKKGIHRIFFVCWDNRIKNHKKHVVV